MRPYFTWPTWKLHAVGIALSALWFLPFFSKKIDLLALEVVIRRRK